jgi:hypothetical protein
MPAPVPPTAGLKSADLEAASENPPKPRRGRPRATPPEWDGMASWTLSGKTRRTVVKQWYMARAADDLDKSEGQDFGYLIGPSRLRSEILAELGQLDDDDRILEAAACVCEHEVKAKDAVAMIRAWRNGKTSPGDSDALANEIITLIRGYQVRHPGTASEQV